MFAAYQSGTAIALYILLTAVITIIATAMMKDYTNQNIDQEYDRAA